MTYGAVVFVLLMIAYFFTIRNLIKENRRKELAITLGFLIAGISEPFLFNTSFKNVSLIFVGSYLLNDANPIRRQNIAWIGICTLGDRSLPKNAPAEKLEEKLLLGLKRIGAAAGEKKYFDCCVDLRLCRDRRHCFWADGTDAQRVSCAQVDL